MKNLISLEDYPTGFPKGLKKKSILKQTRQITREIGRLQHLLYADRRYAVLVIFQGLDATGKDSSTRSVFHYCSPMATWAYGFKRPTAKELDHDFLWRAHKVAPRKGKIQIFNRSYYEDILIQRVEKWIDMDRVEMRMEAINHFEKLLRDDNNTLILKFYMNISKERQGEKLQRRIDDPDKRWKHDDADWIVREKWDDYMDAYHYLLNNSEIPWIIAPCDRKWYRNYFIAKKVCEALEELNLQLPEINSIENGKD